MAGPDTAPTALASNKLTADVGRAPRHSAASSPAKVATSKAKLQELVQKRDQMVKVQLEQQKALLAKLDAKKDMSKEERATIMAQLNKLYASVQSSLKAHPAQRVAGKANELGAGASSAHADTKREPVVAPPVSALDASPVEEITVPAHTTTVCMDTLSVNALLPQSPGSKNGDM